jgi:hypothetical protein
MNGWIFLCFRASGCAGEPSVQDAGRLRRDAAGQVVGGLPGEFAFGWLSIHVLWIEERIRGSGLGTTILEARYVRIEAWLCSAEGFVARPYLISMISFPLLFEPASIRPI